MQPSPQDMQQVVAIIQGASHPTDKGAVQRSITYLHQNSGDPKFNGCLAGIACTAGADILIRAQAALALKQNVSKSFEQGIKPIVEMLKPQLVQALASQEDHIRKAIAGCVSAIAGAKAWPRIINDLWPEYVKSQDAAFRQGILRVVRVVCEDSANILEDCSPGNPPPALSLVPELLQTIMKAQNPNEVQLLLESVHYLLGYETALAESPIFASFESNLSNLLAVLQHCVGMSQQGGSIGKKILNETLGCYKQTLYYYDHVKRSGQLNSILQLVYARTREADAEVSLAACEFWFDLTRNPEAIADLRQFKLVPQLCSLLLDKMVFSDMEVALVMDEEQKEQVKPRGMTKRGKKGAQDDDGDDDDDVDQWTVRTCAGNTLDALAEREGERLITPDGMKSGWLLTDEILPRMQNTNWKQQESAILAFGAISTGCYEKVKPMLPEIIPVLLRIVENQQLYFLVRSMTFWTLSRYVGFIAEHKQFFDRYLKALLSGMTAKERKVQETSVSSFAGLLQHEAQQPGLLAADPEYLNAILQHVGQCLLPGRYTLRNLLILLESIPSLVYFTSEAVSVQVQQCIFAPLMGHLKSLPFSDDVSLPPLLMCLAGCAQMMGGRFSPYVNPAMEKCLEIIGKTVEQATQVAQNPQAVVADMSVTSSVAVELVRAVVYIIVSSGNVGPAVDLLTGPKYAGRYSMAELLLMPLQQKQLGADEYFTTASETLIGENLVCLPAEVFLNPVVAAVPSILSYIDDDTYVAKDSAWLCGEIVGSMTGKFSPDQIQQVVGQMATALVPLLMTKKWDESVMQSIAMTVAKFGRVMPDMMAQGLSQGYFLPMVTNVGEYPEQEYGGEDKTRAFLGIVQILMANKIQVLQDTENAKALAMAMHSCYELRENQELMPAFIQIAQAYKQALGPSWKQASQVVTFPACIISSLT